MKSRESKHTRRGAVQRNATLRLGRGTELRLNYSPNFEAAENVGASEDDSFVDGERERLR